jgi:soluble lytic murein transglycosylase-like protein
MTFSRRVLSLAGLPVFVLAAALDAQNAPAAAQSPLSLQEQSIARQMQAIGSTAAMKQAESFRQQSESIRRQQGSAVHGTSSSPIQPVEEAIAKNPIASPAPAGGNVPALAETAPEQALARTGFYTTPWPASPDFHMPNVQVETAGCDAMGEGEISAIIKAASAKNQVDSSLLRAVMVQESAFRPCAVSTAGAMGLMQIMPETADDLGLADPFDPAANVDAGARYLKQMLDRYHGNTALALAAYNAGPGRTDKANGIPQIPETIGYVSRILSNIPLF